MIFFLQGTLTAFTYDVCDPSRIYKGDKNDYSLPAAVLEDFLNGRAFNYPTTPEEQEIVKEDTRRLYAKTMSECSDSRAMAVITAGAPGSGKTTALEYDRAYHAVDGVMLAYGCPDAVSLKALTRYQADIEAAGDDAEKRLNAYSASRGPSNYATHVILGNLIQEKRSFYFGSTSTGDQTWRFFKYLKEQGYHLRIIHVTAPDDVRWGSIEARDKKFIQTTKEDVINKAELLPKRINDFVTYGDQIDFHYRDGVDKPTEIVAVLKKNDHDHSGVATLEIRDQRKYDSLVAIHNAGVGRLALPQEEKDKLLWVNAVEKISRILDTTLTK